MADPSLRRPRLKHSIISVGELDGSLLARWETLQQRNPGLASPYYRPEFTQLVAAQRPRTRVAVLEQGGVVVGLLPHETTLAGYLKPVGLGLNDYQGWVAAPELVAPPAGWLRACGARYLAFNHVPQEQDWAVPFERERHDSPQMDLRNGWEAYVQRLGAVQSTGTPGVLAAVRQSVRRLERNLGPVRFNLDDRDPVAFAWTLARKSEQWRRTGGAKADAFAALWISSLMDTLFQARGDHFQGVLSTLYAGDHLIAAHFGLRSRGVLHYWFPVYDTRQAYYQPGLVCLLRVAEAACASGVQLIDLGCGSQAYKVRFQTGVQTLLEGEVARPQWLASTTNGARRARKWLKAQPALQALRQRLRPHRQNPHTDL